MLSSNDPKLSWKSSVPVNEGWRRRRGEDHGVQGMDYTNLSAAGYICCIKKNWFEGKCCKILLWGEKDTKCRLQNPCCALFYSKGDFYPRVLCFTTSQEIRPRLAGVGCVPLKHRCEAHSVLVVNPRYFFRGGKKHMGSCCMRRSPSCIHFLGADSHPWSSSFQFRQPPQCLAGEISAFLLLVHLVPPLSYHGHPEQGAQLLLETSKEGEKGSAWGVLGLRLLFST